MKKLIIALFMVVAVATQATAQVDIAFSTSASDSDAGTVLDLDVGDTASMFVWVTNNDADVIDGMGLDILSSDSFIVEALAHLIENPSDRWQVTVEGTLGDLVTDSNAFALVGLGSDGIANDGVAVLHSEIQFSATDEGTTTLTFAENSNTISVLGNAANSLNFGTATVNVGTAIPEPSSIALGIGAIGFACLRRRKRSA